LGKNPRLGIKLCTTIVATNVVPTFRPDGTGVGHIFWYHLETNGMDLGEQRALQDWYVKFALQTVPGVAEVASFGGFENNINGFRSFENAVL
jgi:Cu/Ag efflux pump CusA